MEIFKKMDSQIADTMKKLKYHTLISPNSSSAKDLAIHISFIPKGTEQPLHSHEAEQCYYIVAGKGLLTINEETQEVSLGDAIYIPPNATHGIRNSGEETLEYLSINRFIPLSATKLSEELLSGNPI